MKQIRRQKRRDRKEKIIEHAIKFLTGNTFGKGTGDILKAIEPKIDYELNVYIVSAALNEANTIVNVGCASSNKQGSTWILKEEMDNYERWTK